MNAARRSARSSRTTSTVATPADTRAAFPAEAWDAPLSDGHIKATLTMSEARTAPILGLPIEMRAPVPRPTPREIAVSVAAVLAQKGAPGSFAVTDGAMTVRLQWVGKGCHEGEAYKALVTALQAAGYTAGAMGFGVSVRLDGPVEERFAPVEPPPAPVTQAQPIKCKGWCGRELPFAPAGGVCALCAPIVPAWATRPAAVSAPALFCERGEKCRYHASGGHPYDGCGSDELTVTPVSVASSAVLPVPVPVPPPALSELDPGEERGRSLMGRVLAPFGEV